MSVGDSLLQREGEGVCRGRFGSTMMLGGGWGGRWRMSRKAKSAKVKSGESEVFSICAMFVSCDNHFAHNDILSERSKEPR